MIERLAWADGKWIDLTVVRHPDVPDGRVETHGIRAQAIAAREADRMESILSATVIPLGDLATLDSNAADLATASAGMLQMTVAQPVWYLRSVGRRWPGEERELTWAVIGHDSGLVLASGPRRPD